MVVPAQSRMMALSGPRYVVGTMMEAYDARARPPGAALPQTTGGARIASARDREERARGKLRLTHDVCVVVVDRQPHDEEPALRICGKNCFRALGQGGDRHGLRQRQMPK